MSNKLKQYIIDKSKELNIDIIGFTHGEPFLDAREYLMKRINKNIQTEFEEKDIEKRINPSLTLTSCKSIIVIGISYNALGTGPLASDAAGPVPSASDVGPKLRGHLSRSTWGLDYHNVLKGKMESLIKEISRVQDFEYKYFVDTGPLIDREVGKRAGVGYFGKNCSIINYEYGSFIFLGYILTDLEILVDNEIQEECGNCTLCIDACPTGALEEAYRLNPKKCISYLTQTKDNIPFELRDKMGIKIYGCDTCQLVCPKNKDVKRSNHEEFIPKLTKGYMDLEELLVISNRQFRDKYGHMAGSWRGKTILKRNAIIALGNMKKEENIGLLIKELNDPNPMIRKYASWAILNIYLTRISKYNKSML